MNNNTPQSLGSLGKMRRYPSESGRCFRNLALGIFSFSSFRRLVWQLFLFFTHLDYSPQFRERVQDIRRPILEV